VLMLKQHVRQADGVGARLRGFPRRSARHRR
jgi:hypothetical protein